MKRVLTKLVPTAVILLALPMFSASAGEKPFPKRVPVLDGSYHEGFAIGKGHTAYSGSPDGSIYKVNLRNGKGNPMQADLAFLAYYVGYRSQHLRHAQADDEGKRNGEDFKAGHAF